ncbi:MAG: encapsulin, partial [Nitrospirota bacterium]
MPNSSEVSWDAAVWQEINDAVVKEMAKVRVAQKVFPTTMLEGNPTEVINDVIDFATNTIKEGSTKPFVELYQEFCLTSTQVSKEPQLRTGKTLARMAVKSIALAEDTIIFQGRTANAILKANNIAADLDSADGGLLGEAKNTSLDVKRPEPPKPGVAWGENIFSKVAEGIAKLTEKAQAPKYALFLST